MSNNTLLCLKEKNKAGDILGDTEKTSTDKKRERRQKKKVKHLKIKEKERRLKLKEASKSGENKKQTKAEVTENLKKLTKGGKATILKVSVFSCVLFVSTDQYRHSVLHLAPSVVLFQHRFDDIKQRLCPKIHSLPVYLIYKTNDTY